MLIDARWSFRLAVIVDIGLARKHGPRNVSELAADQRFVLRRCGAEGSIGPAFGQIEHPVHHHELNAQPRIAPKASSNGAFIIRYPTVSGQVTRTADELNVAGRSTSFQFLHRNLNPLR